MFCEVYLLDAPYHIDRPFDYSCDDSVTVGSLVDVPFGKANSKRSGVVVRLKASTDGENVKPVHSVREDRYSFSEEMLGLCLFLKEYTLCTFGEAAKTILPPGAVANPTNIFFKKTLVLNISREG